MDKFVIVAEIQNLSINTDVSMSIEGPIKEYYIYSNHFIQKLNELNKTIIKIKQNDLPDSYSMNINEIIKVLNSSTFIIFEQELDLSLNSKELLNTIENLLSPLINLFSLFLRNFFSINRIYIFSKQIFGYEFCRLIDVYNPNKEVSDEPQLIQILYVDGVETVFPWLLYRIFRKKEFIALISEYLTGRLKAPSNEMKFMLYWNALEHFTHFFWKNKQILKLISKTNLKAINACIKEKINSFNQEDILFPNITPKDIIKKGYLKVPSKPPIREQVFSLIKKIRMDKSLKNVNDLINKVYYIRNKLFHANYYLEDILESFRDKFNCPQFNADDFVNIIKDYELFFEFLILKYFRIIPNYFDYKVSKRWKHFHFLEWKKIKLPSYLLKEKIRKAKLDERFKKKFENRKDSELNTYIYDKNELLSKGKYTPLMKFISRFNQRIKKNTQEIYFVGYTNTRTGFSEIQIKFKENLKGSFYIQSSERHTHFTGGYIINESPVFSKMVIDGSTYVLSFDLSDIRTFPINLPVEYEQINGLFTTLIRDIQKIE